MSKLSMFVPITKVDVARREVWGRAVQEVVDKVDEIFDYTTSKPYFEAWSKSFAEATDGKSLGNIRAMHGSVAAGKVIDIKFDDTAKAIDIGAKIVDENEWAKVLEGVYTGYSIGGKYVGDKKSEKIDGKEVTRYTASPSEISVVDNPCIGTAKFFDVVKADGVIEKVAFKVAAPAIEVTGTDEQVAEFAKLLNEGGLSLSDAITAIKAAAAANKAAAPAKKADDKSVDKGMWNVQDFASALSMVSSIAMSAQSDADWEGDASPVPAQIREWLAAGVKIFKAMADEETAELLAELKTQAGEPVLELALRVGALKKQLDDPELALVDLMKIADENLSADERKGLRTPEDVRKAVLAKAKMSTANMDRLQAAHDHLASMGAACGDADKKAPVGDVTKNADALTTALAKIDEQQKRIEKLEKQPVPYVTLRTLTREKDGPTPATKDVAADDIQLTEADYILNGDGSIDYATSRFIKQQKASAAS